MNYDKKLLVLFCLTIIVGIIIGFSINNFLPKSEEQLITEFYKTEVATSVSPADYIRELNSGKQTGLVVDLRSSKEYEEGHLVTAINIPVVQMSESETLKAFQKLPKELPIITYCYTEYCMLSRKVGKFLTENNIYPKHFTAGWYEIQRDFNSYIINGKSAGTIYSGAPVCGLDTNGAFSC